MEHIVCSCSEGLFLNPLQKEICLISLSAWLRTFCITHVWLMAETRGKPMQQRSGLNTTGISETNPPPPRKDSAGPQVAQISKKIGSSCWMRAAEYLMRRMQPLFHSLRTGNLEGEQWGWGLGSGEGVREIQHRSCWVKCYHSATWFHRIEWMERVCISHHDTPAAWGLHVPTFSSVAWNVPSEFYFVLLFQTISCWIPSWSFWNHAPPATQSVSLAHVIMAFVTASAISADTVKYVFCAKYLFCQW